MRRFTGQIHGNGNRRKEPDLERITCLQTMSQRRDDREGPAKVYHWIRVGRACLLPKYTSFDSHTTSHELHRVHELICKIANSIHPSRYQARACRCPKVRRATQIMLHNTMSSRIFADVSICSWEAQIAAVLIISGTAVTYG